MKRALGLFVPLALVVASCGGDDGGGSGAASDWCTYGAEIRDQGDSFETIDFMNPESLQEGIEELRGALGRALAVAPSEIRDDVATSKQAFDDFYVALAANDFDVFSVDPSVFEDFGDDVDEAGDRIEEYNRRVCGFAPDEDDESSGADADTGTATIPTDLDAALGDLEQLSELMGDDDLSELLGNDAIAGMFTQELITQYEAQGFTPAEARCLADAFSIEEIMSGGFDPTDQAGMFDLFERCDISLQRLSEVGGG